MISEAINRILRIEYTKHLQTTGRDSERFSFKQYRDSPEGKDAQADVYQVIKKQLPSFSVYGKVFTFSDIQSFLEVDALDFNDKAIAALCIENDFVLATADRDYASVPVDIVSSNRAIVG